MNFLSQSTIPISSDYTVVFPYISSQGKFAREAYSPAMTGGRASSEEIDQVLKLFETVSRGMSTPDRFLESWCLHFLLPFAFMLLFQINDNFRYPQFVWSCFALYVIGGNIWMFSAAAKNNSKIKENMQTVLKLYQDTFEKKGLRWHIPANFPLWIALFKDYREQQHQISAPANQCQPVSVENHESTMDKPLLQK